MDLDDYENSDCGAYQTCNNPNGSQDKLNSEERCGSLRMELRLRRACGNVLLLRHHEVYGIVRCMRK